MDDLLIAALADVLRTDTAIHTVHETPPESLVDTPAAVLLESTGEAARDSYRGGWASEVQVRLVLYVTPRTHLPEAVTAARPWVARLLALLSENDAPLYQAPTPEPEDEEDPPPEPPDPVATGELLRLAWSLGVQQYAKTMYAVVEITATYRTEFTVPVTCGL